MTALPTVLAVPADASLTGADAVAPAAAAPAAASPAVVLGDLVPPGGVPAVRWLDRPPDEHGPPAGRVIAPAGDGLWRRAPWPAADRLFELEPPPGDTALVHGRGELARAIAERAAARAVPVDVAEHLDAGALERAAVVVLADSAADALPARAPAVLAAGRLLVTPRATTRFGLQDGLDHLECADADEAVGFVEAYRRVPDVFGRVLTWARVAARPHRASLVYGRLAADL